MEFSKEESKKCSTGQLVHYQVIIPRINQNSINTLIFIRPYDASFHLPILGGA